MKRDLCLVVRAIMSNYYAVKIGKTPGIYRTWDECSQEVIGVKGSKYKKFASESDALAFISGEESVPAPEEVAPKTPKSPPHKRGGNNPIFSIIHPCFGDIGPFHPDKVMYVDGGCNRLTKPYACGSVVNHFNVDLIDMYSSLFPDMTLIRVELPVGSRLLIQVLFSDCATQQNNGAELMATIAGLRIALHQKGQFQYLFSDSSLIVDFWSKRISAQSAEKMDPIKLGFIRELIQLTKEFEKSGGTIYKIGGGANPADLGFHK